MVPDIEPVTLEDGTELERATWQHAGMDCTIVRQKMRGLWSHWCGYVRVPREHPAFCLHYDDPLLDGVRVHGGLTYADVGDGTVRAAGWWLGFDCGHLDDASEWGRSIGLYGDHEWTVAEVVRETQNLARQLAVLGNALANPAAGPAGIADARKRAAEAAGRGLPMGFLLRWADRAEALLAEGGPTDGR